MTFVWLTLKYDEAKLGAARSHGYGRDEYGLCLVQGRTGGQGGGAL